MPNSLAYNTTKFHQIFSDVTVSLARLGEDEKMIREKFCRNFLNRLSKLKKGYSQDLAKQTVAILRIGFSTFFNFAFFLSGLRPGPWGGGNFGWPPFRSSVSHRPIIVTVIVNVSQWHWLKVHLVYINITHQTITEHKNYKSKQLFTSVHGHACHLGGFLWFCCSNKRHIRRRTIHFLRLQVCLSFKLISPESRLSTSLSKNEGMSVGLLTTNASGFGLFPVWPLSRLVP